jgi:CheY-like chemotaxis protein
LRADERLRDVPLIALTGFGGDCDRARAAGAGFRSYLVKPVPYEVLSEVLAGLSEGIPRAS